MRSSQARMVLAGAILVGFAGLGYLVHSSLRNQKKTQVDRSTLQGMLPDAVQWIQNFHRIEIKEGKKSWELVADEAQYLQDQNQVVVRKPVTTFYGKDGEKVVVTGEQGSVQFGANGKDLQKATLHDTVQIHVRGFVIHADDAIYDRDADQIVAAGPVKIDGETMRVAGNNMLVHVKESRFELEKPVHVTLLPKPKTAPRPS